jgi:hypothetical protein
MSDQLSRRRGRKILDRVSKTIDPWDKATDQISNLKERAEMAEAQLIKAKERARDGRARAMAKINRLREALKFYANTDNWDETEDPVITSRDPLGSTPFFHIVFLGQDERWPGHPSSAAIEALEPPAKGESHEQ